VDPELEAVIATLPPEFADPGVAFADPPSLRVRLAELARQLEQSGLGPVQDPRVSRRDQLVPGGAGEPDVPVRVYEPEGCSADGPVILHIHGGAFVIGSIAQDNQSCERMAVATGRPVVSVEYRLSPEHPFPAGITDCFAVYQWLTGGDCGLAIDAERIVVTGVSAGGGLAAAVALKARDANGIQPMYQLLLYPVLDDRMATPSMKALLETPLWNGRSSVHMWRHYLGPEPASVSPYAAPARATDVTGLPPTSIMTAELDPLRDEAIEYAQRLMRAGVPTELHVVSGAIHAFDGLAADITLARRVREDRFAALATVLARTPVESAPKPGERWLDPDVASVVPFLPVGDPAADLATGRRLLEDMLAPGPDPLPGEDQLAITRRKIPGPAGAPDVPVIIYQPRAAADRLACIVDYHGGAFTYGTAQMDHPANVRIASQLGVVVVSVDYRLAPEDPFPAGAEDCYAGLLWVHANAAELGIDTERVAVMGGSAGGALAAAVALMARDRNGPSISFQSLQIPVTDDRLESWSSRTFTETPLFSRPGAEVMWERYLGAGYQGRETSPYAAPTRAPDLSGLPPAYVQTADLDPLRDEGIAYAQRLLQAGVSVELHTFPGTFHGSGLALQATVSQRAAQEMVDVLGAALAVPVVQPTA
jgi:acetyl esterase/lipase